VGNCQLGVFLAYASERGHALVDIRLFLPKAWTDDPERCWAAGVPVGISYQTKAEAGLALLRQAQTTRHSCAAPAGQRVGAPQQGRDRCLLLPVVCGSALIGMAPGVHRRYPEVGTGHVVAFNGTAGSTQPAQ